MCIRSRHVLFFILLLISPTYLRAVTYEWQARSGESPFALDVPQGWRVVESVKKNGVIAQFRKGRARIEVRSFAAKESSSIQQIVNLKAARLASEYSYVRLLDERNSKFRENMHLSVWEIRSRGRMYREETAVVLSDVGAVVVSCFIPRQEQDTYRTYCENAFYSLSLDGSSADDNARTDQKKFNILNELSKLYFVHVPGNLPVLSPEAVLKPGPESKPGENIPKTPVQYDDNFILPNEITK